MTFCLLYFISPYKLWTVKSDAVRLYRPYNDVSVYQVHYDRNFRVNFSSVALTVSEYVKKLNFRMIYERGSRLGLIYVSNSTKLGKFFDRMKSKTRMFSWQNVGHVQRSFDSHKICILFREYLFVTEQIIEMLRNTYRPIITELEKLTEGCAFLRSTIVEVYKYTCRALNLSLVTKMYRL